MRFVYVSCYFHAVDNRYDDSFNNRQTRGVLKVEKKQGLLGSRFKVFQLLSKTLGNIRKNEMKTVNLADNCYSTSKAVMVMLNATFQNYISLRCINMKRMGNSIICLSYKYSFLLFLTNWFNLEHRILKKKISFHMRFEICWNRLKNHEAIII